MKSKPRSIASSIEWRVGNARPVPRVRSRGENRGLHARRAGCATHPALLASTDRRLATRARSLHELHVADEVFRVAEAAEGDVRVLLVGEPHLLPLEVLDLL